MSVIDESVSRSIQGIFNALNHWHNEDGYWYGKLSSSPFATALVLCALSQSKNSEIQESLSHGYEWLIANQNEDGGWSDTENHISSLHSSLLAISALKIQGERYSKALERGERYFREHGGKESLFSLYGKDFTFLTPVLAISAIAGLTSWHETPRLPVGLVLLPQWTWKLLGLPMVSYSLPMFVSIGLLTQFKTSRLSKWTQNKGLRILENIQPPHGGYLECPVASAFVLISLYTLGYGESLMAKRTAEYLLKSQRADGSWPIVIDLSVWNTVLILRAFKNMGYTGKEKQDATRWVLGQVKDRGDTCAWQWTHRPGGIPETDDTSMAMTVLAGEQNQAVPKYLSRARDWLIRIQNKDGGWPTFSRGSGHLPFDRSGIDLTAHVLEGLLSSGMDEKDQVISSGLSYILSAQNSDGSWDALWFGDPYSNHDKNKTYATSQVIMLIQKLHNVTERARSAQTKAVQWLIKSQNPDGGWGAQKGGKTSPEETSLAINGLLSGGVSHDHESIQAGLKWLLSSQRENGDWNPTPIGLYYEALKYAESIYPLAFSLMALGEYLKRTGLSLKLET